MKVTINANGIDEFVDNQGRCIRARARGVEPHIKIAVVNQRSVVRVLPKCRAAVGAESGNYLRVTVTVHRHEDAVLPENG